MYLPRTQLVRQPSYFWSHFKQLNSDSSLVNLELQSTHLQYLETRARQFSRSDRIVYRLLTDVLSYFGRRPRRAALWRARSTGRCCGKCRRRRSFSPTCCDAASSTCAGGQPTVPAVCVKPATRFQMLLAWFLILDRPIDDMDDTDGSRSGTMFEKLETRWQV